VDIVPEQRKTLPVTVSYTSDLPFGSHYGAPIIEPQYADVVGSGQDLAHVNRLVIFVETHANNVSANLPIKPLDQDGVEVSQVHVEPDTAHVDLTLQETPVTKTLLISVPHKGIPAPGYQLTALVPNPSEVQVSGKPSQLIQLYGVSTQEVSVDGLNTDTTETVPLALPPGITLKGSGGLVNVTLQISPIRKTAP
jgi:YbbR domain-containing protein